MGKVCNCAYCGKTFIPKNSKQKYCSVACRDKNKKKRIKENPDKYTYYRERKTRRKAKGTDLGRINEKARAEGLTYGQYVAKYGLW